MQWGRKSNLQAKLHKSILLEDIEKLEKLEEVRLLTSEESHKLSKFRTKILEYYKKEEIFGCQRARSKWLKEGDVNIAYFHRLANVRCYLNRIYPPLDDGCQYGKPYFLHFQKLFDQKIDRRICLTLGAFEA